MKNLFAVWSLLAMLLLPAGLAGACSCGCCPAPKASCSCPQVCCDSCNACSQCSIQCVNLPKRHFWNMKRKGYYVVCPCVTGCAAPVCPTKIGECISNDVPSKFVLIPKRHFWEKDRYQRMPIINQCCKPSCGCCD